MPSAPSSGSAALSFFRDWSWLAANSVVGTPRAGRVINKYKVAKHLALAIGEGSITWTRDQAKIDAEAALDGIYIIRTSVPASELDTAGAGTAYKNLAYVDRDFRSVKADDLDLRPVFHRLDEWSVPAFMDTELGCQLTELPIS